MNNIHGNATYVKCVRHYNFCSCECKQFFSTIIDMFINWTYYINSFYFLNTLLYNPLLTRKKKTIREYIPVWQHLFQITHDHRFVLYRHNYIFRLLFKISKLFT